MVIECYNREIEPGDFILLKRQIGGHNIYSLLQYKHDDIYTDGERDIDIGYAYVGSTYYSYKYENISDDLLKRFNSGDLSLQKLYKNKVLNEEAGIYRDSYGQQLAVGDIVLLNWDRRGSKLGIVVGDKMVINHFSQMRHPEKLIKVNTILPKEHDVIFKGFQYYLSLYCNLENKVKIDESYSLGDSFLLEDNLIIFLGSVYVSMQYKDKLYNLKRTSSLILRIKLNTIDKLDLAVHIKKQIDDSDFINEKLQSLIDVTYSKYNFRKNFYEIVESWMLKDSSVHTVSFTKKLLKSYSKYFKSSNTVTDECYANYGYYLGKLNIYNFSKKVEDDIIIRMFFR